ncbi:MAG: 50S ribosomal protein L9 [Candidatus Paceibacterota bacterium]
MKVVLMKDVQNLGRMGEVKEVAGGYANNFLLPGGYARVATESVMKKAEEIQAQREKDAEDALKLAKEMADKLQGVVVTIKAKADASKKLYAGIKAEEISEALKAKGFEIEKGGVMVDEPIKELGEFEITINLEHGLETSIGVNIEAE